MSTVVAGLVGLVLAGAGGQPQAQTEATATGVSASLDALNVAATTADAQTYLGRLDPELVWIGNDTTERWTYPEFAAFVRPYFERGEGWTYTSRARRVFLAPDPCACLAWVDDVLDSRTYGTAVSTAVMRRGEDGEWRVWRNALTYPIPNDLADGMTDEIKVWEAAQPPAERTSDAVTPETAPIAEALDSFHQAAARADGAIYFDLFTPDAVYRGTDVTELWTLDEFRAFAEPYFASGRGWTYVPRERHIAIARTDCACVAWFDEILDSQSYGTSRGTGVLVRGADGRWRIAYYALTFPIPNALARDMTSRIRAAAEASPANP